jgi:CheY-like chemotaxis protein
MKQVLIIEEAPLLREYLNLKLSENGIEVNLVKNGRVGSSQIRFGAPDLVILDYNIGGNEFQEVLRQKKMNPNTVNIPVILLARRIERKTIVQLLPFFDVKKVFTKPLNPEPLFAAIAEILNVPFKNLDTGPGIVEIHVNNDIIFIEISMGLNRDKLDLLYYKIRELVGRYRILDPKVIVMISNTKLTFADAPNLQKLLETVIWSCKFKTRYIQVLTKDPFVKYFMRNQNGYEGIPVGSSLPDMMKNLLEKVDNADEFSRAKILGERILNAGESHGEESFQMRFNAEVHAKKPGFETLEIGP